jgi:hypothetical protein
MANDTQAATGFHPDQPGAEKATSTAPKPARRATPPSAAERTGRIEQLIQAALESDDHVQATMGALIGDLMLIGHRLSQAIDAASRQNLSVLYDDRSVVAAVDNLLKIDRQIDRFGQLQARLREAEGRSRVPSGDGRGEQASGEQIDASCSEGATQADA